MRPEQFVDKCEDKFLTLFSCTLESDAERDLLQRMQEESFDQLEIDRPQAEIVSLIFQAIAETMRDMGMFKKGVEE